MRTIACCQPHYVPWIGYFEMVDRVDEFWLLDDVDFVKREWKNRNRIRKDRTDTETKWLTVPIERASQRGTHIREARIANDFDWRTRHLDALAETYRRTPFVDDVLNLMERGLSRDLETLGDLNATLLTDLCDHLGITTPLLRTSTLGARGRKTDKLVAVCRTVGADAYLANNGSAGYLEPERFQDAGVHCSYQDYEHPRYEQVSGTQVLPFLSHLSVLDLIANQGPASLEVLRRGGRVVT